MTPQIREELDTLITALLESELPPEAHGRLEELLRGDYECRRHYLAAMDQHARLLTAPAINSGRLAGVQAAATRRRHWNKWAMPLAAAAAVVILGVAMWRLLPQGNEAVAARAAEETGMGCAVLAEALGAKFADGSAPQPGTLLEPGRMRLVSGIVRLEFFSGASVMIEGESDLEIVSAWEAACHRGKARVRVPPPAQGFRLRAPGMKLVDLGTEFGVQVSEAGNAEVRVFEGEVEAHPEGGHMRLLKDGEGLRKEGDTVVARSSLHSSDFTSLEQLELLTAGHAQKRHDQWWAWLQQTRRDPRLIAYYAFKHWPDDRWDRLVNNFAEPRVPGRAGAAVGTRWTQGRWPMKDALEFRGPGDRVRINLGKERYPAVTLACWVRVDALDRRYNALLLTDGYEPGEPHWQIYEDGRLMFSIAYPHPKEPDNPKKKRNQIYYSPSIFNLGTQRRWHHLAVTYDSATSEAVQYLDGREISREVSPFHEPGRDLGFGPCEIGNWGLPTEAHQFPIRNLNGCMDEMLIYGAALSGAEIGQIHEAGRPD